MNKKMLANDEVIAIIADAIGVPASRITANSSVADFAEWDSMGTLALLTLLDRHGVKLEPGDAAILQSVQGVFEAVRKAGRLV